MKRGVVLIFVLVVIALLSLAALTFSELMLAEREAAESAARSVQAAALTGSGVDAARWFLAQDEPAQNDDGGWYDNPRRFRAVLVADDDDPRRRGRFTLVAPAMVDGRREGVRFGLEDESSRLNLNTVLAAEKGKPGTGRAILISLPGMTEPIADAILDWMDADDQTRELGAELEHYAALQPPYAPRNGPMQTVEELLLVRGVTPALLFGVDSNHNGLADPSESDRRSIEGVDNAGGAMDAGWAVYLTLDSRELNVQPDGSPKIDLNQSDMKALYQSLERLLGDEPATFIVAFRQYGPYQGREKGQSAGAKKLDLSQSASKKLSSVLDLVGVRVQAKFEGEDQPSVLEIAFPDELDQMRQYLPKLMDHVAVDASPTTTGRININQASRTVLATVPEMTPELIDQIVARRQPNPVEADASMRHATWLLTEGMVKLDMMKKLMPHLCGGGRVFRAQVVGFFDQGGLSERVEVVFDATKSPAAVLFWRQMSHLGRGYARATLGP